MYFSAPTVWQSHQVTPSAPPLPVVGPARRATRWPGRAAHCTRRTDAPGPPAIGSTRPKTPRPRTAGDVHGPAAAAPNPPPGRDPCPCPHARRPRGPAWGSPVGYFAFVVPYVWTKFFLAFGGLVCGVLLVFHRWLWIVLWVVPVASGLGLLVPRVSSYLGVGFLPPSLSLSWVALRTSFLVLAPLALVVGQSGPLPPQVDLRLNPSDSASLPESLVEAAQFSSSSPPGPGSLLWATSVVLGSQDVSPVIPGVGAATDSVTVRFPAVCWCWETLFVLLPSWLLGRRAQTIHGGCGWCQLLFCDTSQNVAWYCWVNFGRWFYGFFG